MIKLGSVSLDPAAIGSQGNAILGIRDSGKSYTATSIAEQLFDAGIPFTTFDPTGVWRFMRVPGKGRGYPVVVAGGKDPDLPLNVATAPSIVEAAMKNGVSLVLDLNDFELSKADWRRIVTDCLTVMMKKNSEYGLRHVFLEEAAEFAPQKVLDGHVYSVVERLARMGGNFRLGYTLINQRSQEVNKAVLELCENLFLHRQKGKNALENIEKWLELGTSQDAKLVRQTFSTLPTGECWAWLSGNDHATRIKIPEKKSFHPDRRALHGETAGLVAKRVDVGKFVSDLAAALPEIEEKSKQDDPKYLRARIAELEKENKAVNIGDEDTALANGYSTGKSDGYAEGFDAGAKASNDAWHEYRNEAVRMWNNLEAAMRQLGDHATTIPQAHPPQYVRELTAQPTRRVGPPISVPPYVNRVKVGVTVTGGGDISTPEQKVLDAIAWWDSIGNEAPTKPQVCAYAGYSPTASTMGVYLAALKKKDMIDYSGGGIMLTGKGRARANWPDKIVNKRDLRTRVTEILSEPERKVMDIIVDAYPRDLSKDMLCKQAGYSAQASTIGVYLAALRKYQFVEKRAIKAAEWLF